MSINFWNNHRLFMGKREKTICEFKCSAAEGGRINCPLQSERRVDQLSIGISGSGLDQLSIFRHCSSAHQQLHPPATIRLFLKGFRLRVHSLLRLSLLSAVAAAACRLPLQSVQLLPHGLVLAPQRFNLATRLGQLKIEPFDRSLFEELFD